MILFEATNGMIGVSYLRRYIWAATEDRARELVSNLHGQWELKEVMNSSDAEFMTDSSDEGWEKI